MFKGRSLKVPKTVARPTTSRVRESLFALIESHWSLEGATVLDLFAGSGAFSFEALSRGASFALMCDKSPEALRILDYNATLLGVDKRAYTTFKADTIRDATYTRLSSILPLPQASSSATLSSSSSSSVLNSSTSHSSPKMAYDFVFLDPPYAFTDTEIVNVLQSLTANEMVSTASVIVVESGKVRDFEGSGFEEAISKKYGTTVLQFLRLKH